MMVEWVVAARGSCPPLTTAVGFCVGFRPRLLVGVRCADQPLCSTLHLVAPRCQIWGNSKKNFWTKNPNKSRVLGGLKKNFENRLSFTTSCGIVKLMDTNTTERTNPMTTTNTDTREAHLFTCNDCSFAGVVEPRVNFRGFWIVTDVTSQAPSRTAAEKQMRTRHSNRCDNRVKKEAITDFVMSTSGDISSAVFASRNSR